MDGNEIQSKSIQILIMTTPSSLCSNPLFSCIVTLYALILIFYPYALKFLFSPVLIFTSLLLLLLLRLGAGQRRQIPAEKEKIVENRDSNLDPIERNSLSLDRIDNWVKSNDDLDSGIPVEAEKNVAGEGKIGENRDANLDSIERNSLSLDQIDNWVESDAGLDSQIPEEAEKNVAGEEIIGENGDTNLDSIERNSLSLDQIDNWVKSNGDLDSQIPEEAEKNVAGEEKLGENRDTISDSIEKDSLCLDQIDKWVNPQTQLEFESRGDFEQSFVEWNVRAPLEVIYEAYEGEEDDQDCGFSPIQSLSMYYPETDSDSDSDGGFPAADGGWDSPESVYLKWEEEDKDGMMIEIALDSDGKHRSGMGFHFEEDNLIEIDISPRGNDSFNAVLV